jgi:hypothetical protein
MQDQSINSYLFIGVIFCWRNSPGLNSINCHDYFVLGRNVELGFEAW